MKEKDKISEILLEAVWYKNKSPLSTVLDSTEAFEIVKNIFEELDKGGYQIVKK